MELVWVVREDDAANANQWNHFSTYKHTWGQDFTGTGSDTILGNKAYVRGLNPFGANCKLQIHGQDRFAQRDGDYFTRYQPYKYHTRVPKSAGVAVYSFSLNPESKQPNGTANFSRIDQPTLVLNFTQVSASNTAKLFVYARNVNLFRVAGGMGGVAFSS
jgi:hypothetical protein